MSREFRDGFESSWANLEFLADYERGETEYLAPMYGLCRECAWPLEGDRSQCCRKCTAVAAKKAARWGFVRGIVRSVRGGDAPCTPVGGCGTSFDD